MGMSMSFISMICNWEIFFLVVYETQIGSRKNDHWRYSYKC